MVRGGDGDIDVELDRSLGGRHVPSGCSSRITFPTAAVRGWKAGSASIGGEDATEAKAASKEKLLGVMGSKR